MPDGAVVELHETVVPGMSLGRHVHHKPENRRYPMSAVLGAEPLRTYAWWKPRVVFDQGNESSCTFQATSGAVITSPVRHDRTPAVRDQVLSSSYRHGGYLMAQDRDPWEGREPAYYGTTCEAAARAARDLGLIDAYHWAFGGLDDVLQWLAHQGPVVIGITWWSSFDNTPTSGVMPPIGGYVRGGHAIKLDGLNLRRRDVLGQNSWGTGWGAGGRFRMSWATLEQSLADMGEAVGFVNQ